MTIDTPSGKKLEIPEMPEITDPATIEQHMAFATWQDEVTRIIFNNGLECQWIHDELTIYEPIHSS
jgi:hypothetical protein